MRLFLEPASKPNADYRDWDPRSPDVVRSLVSALSPLPSFLSIEHVGSTAIPGCGGKNVIDLLALYATDHLDDAKTYLLALGFCRQGTEFARAWPDERPMFLGNYRWNAEPYLIYIHILHEASDEVRRFRVFNERLVKNPAFVTEYCELKRRIVLDGIVDTDEYAVRKRSFMHKVLRADRFLRDEVPER